MKRMNRLQKGLCQVACSMSRYQAECCLVCCVPYYKPVRSTYNGGRRCLPVRRKLASHYRRLQRFLSGTWSPQVATQFIVQQLVKPCKPILFDVGSNPIGNMVRPITICCAWA